MCVGERSSQQALQACRVLCLHALLTILLTYATCCPLPHCATELDPAEAAASDPATGELKYGWSNICLHYFRRDWLEAVSGRLADMGRYHIARKKIPSKDGPVAVSGAASGGWWSWSRRFWCCCWWLWEMPKNGGGGHHTES